MAKKQSNNKHYRQPVSVSAVKKPADNKKHGKKNIALIALLSITAIVYANAINNGITYLDDYYYILTNPFLQDFSWHGVGAIFTSFYSGNYHPLTTLTYFVEYHFFKDNPVSYHIINVLLHLGNTLLVYFLAQKLSGKKTISLVVTFLFALHPMHVESVAWISERKDVLYTFFYLFALLVYLKYISESFSILRYAVLILLFLLSLLSKSAAVTLPLVFLLFDYYNSRKITLPVLVEKIPFLALSILFGILAIKSQSAGNAIISLADTYGFANRAVIFTAGLSAYLTNLVFPYNLTALHYYPILENGYLPYVYYLSIPFLIALIFLLFMLKTWRNEIIFGSLFFLITISVMLQFLSVGTAMYSERYTYVPYIGLFLFIGRIVDDYWQTEYKNILMAICSVFALFFVTSTWQRIGVWKDSISLFTDVIEKNGTNANISYAYQVRGNVKLSEHHLQEAIEDYNEAIKLNPKFESAYWNRAHAFDELGNLKAAIFDLDKSAELNPKLPETYNDRGWCYFRLGDAEKAMADFNKAIELHPKYTVAFNNRGWLYYKLKDIKNALANFDSAIICDPKYMKPYYNIAMIKAESGDWQGAVAANTKIIQLMPNEGEPYFNRGLLYHNLKQDNLACEDWIKAEKLGNQNAKQGLMQYCK